MRRKKKIWCPHIFFLLFSFFSSLLFFSEPGRPPAAEGGVVIGERGKGGRPRVGWWAKQASEISYSSLGRSRFVATMMWRRWFSDKMSFDGSTNQGSVQWWWGRRRARSRCGSNVCRAMWQWGWSSDDFWHANSCNDGMVAMDPFMLWEHRLSERHENGAWWQQDG